MPSGHTCLVTHGSQERKSCAGDSRQRTWAFSHSQDSQQVLPIWWLADGRRREGRGDWASLLAFRWVSTFLWNQYKESSEFYVVKKGKTYWNQIIKISNKKGQHLWIFQFYLKGVYTHTHIFTEIFFLYDREKHLFPFLIQVPIPRRYYLWPINDSTQ